MNVLSRIVAWILALALVALPIVAALNGWIGGERWPMRHLVVTGEFHLVSDAQVRQAVLPYVQKGFFAVDLKSIRTQLAHLPWVQRVGVRKRWPDRLEISISEYRPLARWGSDRMLSENGALFATPKVPMTELPQGLPRFDGPPTRRRELIVFYREAKPLFLNSGLQVREVALSARGGWRLLLSDRVEKNDIEIEVGRGDPQARLQRFARLLPRINASDSRQLVHVDLRYTNGFALTWGAKTPSVSHTSEAMQVNI